MIAEDKQAESDIEVIHDKVSKLEADFHCIVRQIRSPMLDVPQQMAQLVVSSQADTCDGIFRRAKINLVWYV